MLQHRREQADIGGDAIDVVPCTCCFIADLIQGLGELDADSRDPDDRRNHLYARHDGCVPDAVGRMAAEEPVKEMKRWDRRSGYMKCSSMTLFYEARSARGMRQFDGAGAMVRGVPQ